MSGSGRKEFDVKHILRLRWKLFNHPPSSSSGTGGCPQQQQQDSFEHWGTSQNRLKNHSHDRGIGSWKKSSALNGILPPGHSRGGTLQCQTQQRTVFYVETLEEVPRLEFTREGTATLEEVKKELVNTDCCEGTGDGCLHRLTVTSHPLMPHSDLEAGSSEELFQAVNHAEQTFCKMEIYLKQQQLCDVILIAGNRKIPAHRLVLSAVSDYFAAMFTSDVCEAKQEEVKMEGIDPGALWDLVQFAYTGCLELKEETIENLLAAACLLQLSQVVEVCCHFLMKLLHPSNCLGIRAFADAQGCTELMKVAHSYTMEHIMEVIKNQEFLLLPADDILKLIVSDDVNVPDEETIFHALMLWVKYDMPSRCRELGKLLAYIRLPLLPPQTRFPPQDMSEALLCWLGWLVGWFSAFVGS
ncbi:hypothetical protein chiPu_0002323 [Chiloscyllium punctatum]|uniref:BTB domain-containing protein n=1 Tax=Chiloscyllium punctatum TaxID=137246 RepID=A0A401S0M2_CHIPU|nr:hypothetical protein [Chiloscyllium punctatum]